MVRAFAGRATVDTYAGFLDHRGGLCEHTPSGAFADLRARSARMEAAPPGADMGNLRARWCWYGRPDPPIALLGLVGVTALADARLPLGWLRFLVAMTPVTIVITGASVRMG